MTDVAFGGIVWREGPDGVELLLVHRPRYDDWGFPKGKPHPGESSEETALREVWEETGLRCLLGRPVGHKEYTLPGGGEKTCHYWAMTPTSGEFRVNQEVDEIRWVHSGSAPDVLTYPSDVGLLQGLPADWIEAVPRLFLVRHAEAGTRDEANPEDWARQLTEQGRRQAAGLVDLLATERIDGLLSSPAVRCIQTLEPLSRTRRLPITQVEELMEGSAERSLAYLAKKDAVLCTHGDVVPVILDSLLEDGCDFPSPKQWEKGSTWVIEFEDELPVRARYLPPPT